MSSITITRSDGTTLSIIGDRTADTSTCALNLIGRGYTGDWVTPLNNNLVRLLENSSGAIAPSGALDGQLWWNRAGQVMNVYSGGGWEAVGSSSSGADLAERYAADCHMEPGDVVQIGGAAEITLVSSFMSKDVFGVISTTPAFHMNSRAGTSESHPFVALIGRAPCKVWGKVKKGDRLVSAEKPGYAVAWLGDIAAQAIVGRALADKTSDGAGMLEIVVGRL